MTRVNKGKSNKLKILITILVILITAGLIFKFAVYDKAMDRVTKEVSEAVLLSEGLGSDEIDEIINSMTDEDKSAVEDIIENHYSAETFQEAYSYYSEGDMQGLKEYAKENLSEEEISELYELYEKYYASGNN